MRRDGSDTRQLLVGCWNHGCRKGGRKSLPEDHRLGLLRQSRYLHEQTVLRERCLHGLVCVWQTWVELVQCPGRRSLLAPLPLRAKGDGRAARTTWAPWRARQPRAPRPEGTSRAPGLPRAQAWDPSACPRACGDPRTSGTSRQVGPPGTNREGRSPRTARAARPATLSRHTRGRPADRFFSPWDMRFKGRLVFPSPRTAHMRPLPPRRPA